MNRQAQGTETPSVTRYVPTYVDGNGQRTLMLPRQGRHTFASAADAQAWLDAVLAENSSDRLTEMWGAVPRFEVRPVACWPVHFDPQTCWFED